MLRSIFVDILYFEIKIYCNLSTFWLIMVKICQNFGLKVTIYHNLSTVWLIKVSICPNFGLKVTVYQNLSKFWFKDHNLSRLVKNLVN